MDLPYVLAELTRRPGRLLAGVLSVAVGLALFVSLQSYATGYRSAARTPLSEIGTDIIAQRQGERPLEFEGVVFPHSTAPLHRDEIEQIRRLPGVTSVGETIFFWDFVSGRFVVGLGLDPAESVGPGRLRAGLREGRFLEPGDHGVAVADTNYAAENNLTLGSVVTIANQAYTIVGLVDTSRAGQVANANFYVPFSDAQAFAHASPNVLNVHDFRADDANILFIRAEPGRAPAVAEQVRSLLGSDAIVTTPRSFDQVLGATFDLIDRFGLLVGLAGVLVGTAGLLRTTAAGLLERRRDVGLMRAVGWRRSEVVRQLLAETLALAGLGALTGLGLASLASWGLGFTRVEVPVPWELSPTPMFVAEGPKKMGVTVPLDASVSPELAVGAFILALLAGSLVSLWMARRAAGIKPAEVWRSE